MKRFSRREFVQSLGVAAGAAALPAWLAACNNDKATAKLRTGALEPGEVPIDHVVCIMLENRSFDTYFGSLSLLEGRTDIDGLTPALYNVLPSGRRFSPLATPADLMCVEDPPHSWDAWDIQSAGGTNLGFSTAHVDRHTDPNLGQTVMNYHTRAQVPFLMGLGDDFALCQRWFASVRGPTYPNRWYLHAGTSNGVKGNVDGDPDLRFVFDQLAEKDKTWAYYYEDVPFLALAAKMLDRHRGSSPMRSVKRFFSDLDEGTLPNYVQLDAAINVHDDHPPAHPGRGQQFIAQIYNALAKSSYWSRSLFIVCYDECGGFFDHVPPPKTEDDFAAAGFDQLGFRVPAVVAGPYVGKQVSSTVFDHTSVLKFLQWKWGMDPLSKRNAAANNLADLLDPALIRGKKPRKPPTYADVTLPQTEIDACRSKGYPG